MRLLSQLGFPPAEAASWADIGYTTVVGMMSRSTRDPRFRRWPQVGYLAWLLEAAQLLVEREATTIQSARSHGRNVDLRSFRVSRARIRGPA